MIFSYSHTVRRGIFSGFFIISLGLFPEHLFAQAACSNERQIVLIDRTSVPNEAEKRAMDEGLRVLFSRSDFKGEVQFAEIRGSQLRTEWFFNTCVPEYNPSPFCEEYFDSRSAETSNWKNDPVGAMLDFLFPSDVARSSSEALECLSEEARYNEERKAIQESALEAVLDVAKKPVPSSETAIARSIVRVARSHCSEMDCDLFVFSNLLDHGWHDILDASEPNVLGAEFARKEISERSVDAKYRDIVVWGFGFNELDRERKSELETTNPGATTVLRRYWTGFFGEMVSGSVDIGFDMPQ